MKNLKNLFFGLLVAVSFGSCQDGGLIPPVDIGPDEVTTEATILGRWVDPDFADVIRYEFTEEARYTIYGDGSGEFPTLEELIESGMSGNDYFYAGDTLVLDLHFGHSTKLLPEFKCDNEVLELTNFPDSGGAWIQTLYREGHDINECN